MLLREILEEMGCAVTGPVSDLNTAVQTVRSGAFDAAVLDVNLGGSYAYPLAEQLRSQDIPFVFLTGYAQDTLDERFSAAPDPAKAGRARCAGDRAANGACEQSARGFAPRRSALNFRCQVCEASARCQPLRVPRAAAIVRLERQRSDTDKRRGAFMQRGWLLVATLSVVATIACADNNKNPNNDKDRTKVEPAVAQYFKNDDSGTDSSVLSGIVGYHAIAGTHRGASQGLG